MPRLFTAVDLSPAARAALAAIIDGRLRGKWVPPQNLHITLRFLGSVAPERLPEIDAALGHVKFGPPFTLALAGVGAFPPHASPAAARVVWAGVTPHAPLQALKAAIDAALGPDPESGRGYSPHVTLARLPHTRSAPLEPYLAAHAALSSAAFPIDSFALYESRTLPTGAEYRVLTRYPL